MFRSPKTIALIVATLLMAAPAVFANDLHWRLEQVNVVREMAFRDEMHVFDKGHPAKNALYFLSIGDGIKKLADPPDDLMKLFLNDTVTYEPATACEVHNDYVQDAKTLKRGTLFWVSSVWWLGDHMADVDCGYSAGGLITDKQIKRFAYEHGAWKIIDRKVQEY